MLDAGKLFKLLGIGVVVTMMLNVIQQGNDGYK